MSFIDDIRQVSILIDDIVMRHNLEWLRITGRNCDQKITIAAQVKVNGIDQFETGRVESVEDVADCLREDIERRMDTIRHDPRSCFPPTFEMTSAKHHKLCEKLRLLLLSPLEELAQQAE